MRNLSIFVRQRGHRGLIPGSNEEERIALKARFQYTDVFLDMSKFTSRQDSQILHKLRPSRSVIYFST